MSEKEKAFDETPYLFDEFKWKFDESTTVCSLCGQRLPEDKIEQLKTDFEEKKAKAKEDAAERLKTIRESFNNQKVAELNRIASLGTDKKSEIEIMKSDIEDAEKKLPELREQETEQMKIKKQSLRRRLRMLRLTSVSPSCRQRRKKSGRKLPTRNRCFTS